MSALVEKYINLSKEGFNNPSDANLKKLGDEMAELKKQFKESDWDELIASVPLHIRPMLKKQKEKFLSK